MALDFQALYTEFYARGFNYLNDGGAGVTRAKRFINDARDEINDMDAWPYLQASTSGTAPLTVSDLGRVETVVDSTNDVVLAHMDRASLTETYADLSTTGNPAYFYITAGNVVNVYPANTSVTVAVKYTKFESNMSANGDTPLMPDRYRMAIVHYAVADALEDKSNYQEAAAARARGDLIIGRMREFYLLQSGYGPSQVLIADGSEDS